MRLRKRKAAKVVSIGLAVTMVITSYMCLSADTAFAAENDTYIVIVRDKDGADAVKEGYHVVDQSGEALTLAISPSEAAALDSEKDVLCVEKDFTMGNENEATPDLNKVKPAEADWNLEAVNALNPASSQKIKVAIIDSGVDYSENVQIWESRDFITDDPVTTPLYEDRTGHGTSVASLLAGTKEDGEVKGIDSNVQLYSARVLDENNQAPVSRVVSAIYWAMEKDVNIINISFGTPVYSEALKTAIDAATDQGILVVAAAGNRGSSGVDYPAAFENVLAVGSINASGEVSDFSAKGDGIDVVAPGEAVLAQAHFGEDFVLSGTSLAAPQVSGIAALLWSRDTTKPASFIKTLIKTSAKPMSDAGSGYGLVDYAYALQIYDDAASQFDKIAEAEIEDPADKDTAQKEENPTGEEDAPGKGDVANPDDNPSDETSDEIKNPVADIEKTKGENLTAAAQTNELTDGNISNEEMKQDQVTEGENLPSDKAEVTPDQKTEDETQKELQKELNSKEFEQILMKEISITENNGQVTDLSDPIVDGSWGRNEHQKYAEGEAMKHGAVVSDDDEQKEHVAKMTIHPEFHGYCWHGNPDDTSFGSGVCNYVANYKYLILVANRLGNGTDDTKLTASSVKGLRSDCFNALKSGVAIIKKHPYYAKCKTKAEKRAFMMGVAMHTATDAFAHSAYTQRQSGSWPWVRIKHDLKNHVNDADDPTWVPRRIKLAYAVENNVLDRYNGKRSGENNIGNDLHADTGSLYDNPIGFRLNKIWTFANATGVDKTIIVTHFKKLQGIVS